jgi:hypothetical protein
MSMTCILVVRRCGAIMIDVEEAIDTEDWKLAFKYLRYLPYDKEV